MLYRNLFNSMEEEFCVIEVLFDPHNKPIDWRFIEVNESYEKQTGIPNPVGKAMRQIVPNREEHWFEFYGKVALTGDPGHLVNEAMAIDGYYEVRAYRVGLPEQRRVAVVFSEISQRMRADKTLREQAELLNLAHDNCAMPYQKSICRHRSCPTYLLHQKPKMLTKRLHRPIEWIDGAVGP